MSDLPTLMFVNAPATPETFNVLAYGPPKSGKSTFAATAPGPILWVNAEGPGALAYARKTAASRGTVIHETRLTRSVDARQLLREVLEHVRSGGDPACRTVVIDTLAQVRDALVRQLVDPGSKNSLRQYGDVNRILKEFVSILRDEPVNLVVLAHEDIKDADGDRVVEPLIGGALTQFVPGEVDVVTYTGAVRDDETGDVRYMGGLVESRGRRAGDRSSGLGAVRPLDLADWLDTYRQALTPDAAGDELPFSETA